MKPLVLLALAVAALVSLTSVTDASDCHRPGYCATPVYVPPAVVVETPVVVSPAVIPILVPSYTFQFLGAVATPAVVPAVGPVAAPATPVGVAPAVAPAPAPVAPTDDWPVARAPGSPAPVAVASLDSRVAGILKVHCAACHQGPGGRGGLSLLDAAGNLVPGTDWNAAYDAVASGRMPRANGGQKTTVAAAELQTLREKAQTR